MACKDHCHVCHRARDRPHVVERDRKRNHAPGADPSISWLQANHAAQRRGFPNRAGCVGADRAVTQSRSDRGGRASGRPAGDVFRIPRVSHFAEVAHHRAAAVSELVQILFSQQHSAGSFQAADNFSVFRGNAIFEQRLAAVVGHQRCRSDPSGRVECHAAGHASRRAGSRLPPGVPAQRGVRRHRNESVQPRIQLLDARQAVGLSIRPAR